MSVETSESVSLETIVSCADVSIIGYHKVVLSDLIGDLLNHGARVLFGNLRELSSP